MTKSTFFTKKRMAVLLIAAVALIAVITALAFSGKPKEASLSAVGDELCGFRVTQIVHNQQYDLDFIHMEHEKTGAQLVYIPSEDTERSFTVAFRTPAENDKGIPHVYEHSTLGGSEKYPDPSLFFSMINQTYNTYLNAGTYISNTTFPSASLSEEQLLAFADYTMDGLYHPMIMTDERTMMREAYRYELADEDAPLTLTGTVYSEMKAHTNPYVLSLARAMKMLFPGSRFAAFNGGDPDHIPEMTWQELKDFHDKYYHPSNSLTVLYGKLDPKPFLALIDREIRSFDRQEIVLTDENYTPINGNIEEKSMIPVSADSPKEAYIYYGIPLDSLSDHEMDVLQLYASMYVADGSPIYNLFAEQMPGVTVDVQLITDAPVPALCFSVIGAGEEEAGQVKQLLFEGLAQTARQGIDGEMMKSMAMSTKLQIIQMRENNNKGVNIGELVATAWGPQGDLMAYVESDRRLAQVLELADAEAMRSIAEKHLVNPQTSAYGVYVTAPGELEKKNAQEEARLVQMKEDMSAEERAALIARTEDFAQWTQANAANTMIDTVKVVDAQNLPEEIVRYEAVESVQNGIRFIRADVDSDELVYVQLVFTADSIPYEKYDQFDTYIQLIGSLNTANYSSDALLTAIMSVSSDLSISRSTVRMENDGFRPVVTVSWSCLPENIDACYELAQELIWRTDTTDVDHARMSLSASQQSVPIYLAMDPSFIISNLVSGFVSNAGRFDALPCMGSRFTDWLNMADLSDEELAALLTEGQSMLLDVMRKENLTVCAVGSQENNDKAVAAGIKLAAGLSEEPGVHYNYLALMEEMPASIAFPMDIDVGYNALVIPYQDIGCETSGQLTVFCNLVMDRVLMPELRFKNSCYGAVFQAGKRGILLYSYRDPNLAETYAFYDNLADMVRALELTQEDINGFIVSTFSQFSMPMGPMTGGKKAVQDKLNGEDTFADILRYMHEAKQTTPEDIQELAAVIDMMAEQGVRLSVNSQRLVEENSSLFAVTDDCYMFSSGAAGEPDMETPESLEEPASGGEAKAAA